MSNSSYPPYEKIPKDIELHRPKRIAFAHDLVAEGESEDGSNFIASEPDEPDSKTGKDIRAKIIATES